MWKMKPPDEFVDSRSRIFNKSSVGYEESMVQLKTKPATLLPLTEKNVFMHNLSSSENSYGMEVNKNEHRFLTRNWKCRPSSSKNRSDLTSWIENTNLMLKKTSHKDTKNESDLLIKESRSWSLQQQEKDSSEQVIDKCNSLLPSYKSDMCLWVERDRLASIQETLRMDVNNESDLWIKENRLRALQQLGKDSSEQVNEYSLFLQKYQPDMCSLIENDHLIMMQQTLHINARDKSNLYIKQNQFWSLQEGKDSSDHVVGESSSFLPNNQSDLFSWMENDRLTSIQEKLSMDANIESDLGIKENRVQALKRVGNDSSEKYSSNSYFASYRMEMSRKTFPDMMHNSLNYQTIDGLPQSSENLISSSEEDFSKRKAASNRKDKLVENEMPLLCEELKVQSAWRKNFSNIYKSSPTNSIFFDKQKDIADEKAESFYENTTEFGNLSWHKMSLIKEEAQFSDEFVKGSKSESSGCNKIESPGCNLLHERVKIPMVRDKNNLAKFPISDVFALMTLKSTTGFFDSHCHLDFLLNRQGFYGTYSDYMAQHKDTYPESYKGCIAVFCKPLTFAKNFIWQKYLEEDNVWAAFGCHPKEALDYNDQVEEDLKSALNHHKVKALGEIGLDYSKGNTCPKDVQQNVFRRQLIIAKEKKMRLVIHCRDADDDTIRIMLEIFPKDIIFHLHCFTGNWEIAQRWIGKFPNVFIGITNLVTYPSATPTHEVARRLPLDRLLLETDAPYFVPKLAPEGTYYSHPGMAIHVAAQVAALQNIPIEKVLQWTSSNTKIIYDIQ